MRCLCFRKLFAPVVAPFTQMTLRLMDSRGQQLAASEEANLEAELSKETVGCANDMKNDKRLDYNSIFHAWPPFLYLLHRNVLSTYTLNLQILRQITQEYI